MARICLMAIQKIMGVKMVTTDQDLATASDEAEAALKKLQTDFEAYQKQLEEMTEICDKYQALYKEGQVRCALLLSDMFSVQTYIEKLGRFAMSRKAKRKVLGIISEVSTREADSPL